MSKFFLREKDGNKVSAQKESGDKKKVKEKKSPQKKAGAKKLHLPSWWGKTRLSSIGVKLVLGFGVVIGMMLLLSSILLNHLVSSQVESYETMSKQSLLTTADYLKLGLQSVESRMLETSVDKEVYALLRGSYDKKGFEKRSKMNEILEQMNAVQVSNDFIKDITIIGSKNTLITTISPLEKSGKSAELYSSYKESEDGQWLGNKTNESLWSGKNTAMDTLIPSHANTYSLSLVRATTKSTGYVMADISTDAISSALSNMNTRTGEIAGYITEDGQCVLLECTKEAGEDEEVAVNEMTTENQELLSSEFITNALQKTENNIEAHYATLYGKEYLFSYAKNDEIGYILFQMIPSEIIQKQSRETSYVILLYLVVAVILCLIISTLIIWSVKKSIKSSIIPLKKAAAGDLTVRADSSRKDEFATLNENINSMASGMQEIIRKTRGMCGNVGNTVQEVQTDAEHIMQASEDIFRAIKEIEEGAVQQSEDTQHCLEEMQLLSEKVDTVAEQTNEISGFAKHTRQAFQSGTQMMGDLDEKSGQTIQITGDIVEEIHSLKEKAGAIDHVVDIINGIASQTNLLALNAAIEAARAGDAGRGFAVVAGEIQNLAAQTMQAASQITKMVTEIQDVTGNTADTASKAGHIVEEQKAALADTITMFTDLNQQVEGLMAHLRIILSEVKEMEEASDSVIVKIKDISEVAEESAVSAEEVKNISGSQVNGIKDLGDLVEKLSGDMGDLEKAMTIFKTE